MSMVKEQEGKTAGGLREKFGIKNPMATPRLEKVVLNTGFGRLVAGKTGSEQEAVAEAVLKDMAAISGQRPAVTRARSSVSGFKLREGMPVGAKVTLRGARMYDFLDRLVHVVLPRSRDFRGLSRTSVDENGNLTIGLAEHIFFPEIAPEQAKNIFGLEVTVVSTAQDKEQGTELFEKLGFPLQKNDG